MSLKHLRPETLEALRCGRAIVFLADWPPPEVPDYLLSVVARLDDSVFEMSLMPKRFRGKATATVLPTPPLTEPIPLGSESHDDAQTVHRLWHWWQTSFQDEVLMIIKRVARQLEHEALSRKLESLQKAPGRSDKAKSKKARKANPRRTKKASRG